MRVIEIDNLTRDYGKGKGVFHLSFRVNRGEVFGFLGPNGAGKTTTIRHLMGFLMPEAGSCTILGLDCWDDREKIQQNLGYIPGEISFFDDMTGGDFLSFLGDYRGLGRIDRKWEMLELFQLDSRSRIKKMSKGMKQKLGIAAAFMHDPEILILDEPTSGLDPLMQNRFIDLIAEEKRRGKTILLSSHMFEEVERTCDQVGIIRQGRLAAVDSVQAMRERYVKPYRVTLETEALAKAFARDFGGTQDGKTVTVSTKKSLEEVFLQFYGGDRDA